MTAPTVRKRLAAVARHRPEVAAAQVEPSTRLRFVAGMFTVSATIAAVAIPLFFVVTLATYNEPRLRPVFERMLAHPWKIALALPLMLASIAFQLWVARELHRRSRVGGYSALFPLAVAMYHGLTHHGYFELACSTAALACLVASWKELE